MSFLAWFAIGLGIQLGLPLVKPRNLARGYITRWMMRLTHTPSEFRYFYRILQLFMLLSLEIATLLHPVGYWVIVVVLYGDDWLFGDDEFKKKLKEAKNKIKWKMKVPVLDVTPE